MGNLNIFDTTIQEVIPEKLDLDLECLCDMITGKGIRIYESDAFVKNGTSNDELVTGRKKKPKFEKTYHGLQSPFFGTDFADNNAFKERWSCKCGRYIGKAFEGRRCEECNTKVEYVDVDLEKTGWIIIDYFQVMSPIFYEKLLDALGTYENEKVLHRILKCEFTREEKKEEKLLFTMEKLEDERKKHPFVMKGMTWLSSHLKEVLDYYQPLKPTKTKLFNELRKDIDKVFTHCIPVITSVLRMETPGEIGGKQYKLRINSYYQSIIRSVNRINIQGPRNELTEKEECQVDRYLFIIQKEIGNVFQEIFNILDGKKGFINGQVISCRLNFSARNIIASDSGYLRTNEIIVGYLVFVELFRYEIINIYSKLRNCTIVEAEHAWKRAKEFYDDVIYQIIEMMIENDQAYLNFMINRNPSINFGAFMIMKIAHVTKDINNKTLVIPTRILQVMNADHDGDMLNIFRLIGIDLAKRFGKNLDPRYNLYIDRVNGRVNREMMPIKDEVIGFWAFNNY